MPAERRGAATLDRRHHLQLIEADVPGIGSSPCRSMAAENIRDLQRWTGQGCGPLCRRRVFVVLSGVLAGVLARLLPGFLSGLGRQVEWALVVRVHVCGAAGVGSRCLKLVMTQKRLDDSNIGAAFEQMGRETVAQSVQTHPLPDAGPIGRLVEQPVELAGGHWLARLAARKEPAFLKGRCVWIEPRTSLPPLSQEIDHLRRQHDIAILATLGLLDANDLLRAIDMFDLQPDHFAGSQAAAIAKTERDAGLEARGNSQHATRLVWTHHLRDLLGLAEVIDLGCKIQPPQRHAE